MKRLFLALALCYCACLALATRNLRQTKEMFEREEELEGLVHEETFIGGWDISLQPGFTFALTYTILMPYQIVFDDSAPIAISEATHNILRKKPAPFWINTQVETSKQAVDSPMRTSIFHTTVVTALNTKDSKHERKVSEELVKTITSSFKDGRFKEELSKLADEKKRVAFQHATMVDVKVEVIDGLLDDISGSSSAAAGKASVSTNLTPYFIYSHLTTMVLFVSLVLCLVYLYSSFKTVGLPTSPPSPYKRKYAQASYV